MNVAHAACLSARPRRLPIPPLRRRQSTPTITRKHWQLLCCDGGIVVELVIQLVVEKSWILYVYPIVEEVFRGLFPIHLPPE